MKRVLVTGATKGIGRAVAEKFKSQGWSVIGSGTKYIPLPDYLDYYLNFDFSKKEDLKNFCDILKDKDISTLINNAGINIVSPFLSIKEDDFEKIHQVNLTAPLLISQTVIPNMLKTNWGRIVNISSIWGKKSRTGRASYSASKFGIDGLTVAMADEFASQGILCNCVAPGFIDTEMTWKNLGQEGVEKILQQARFFGAK